MTVLALDALQEAAEWFACLADPEVGESERQRWQIWLTAHPDHAAAWQKVEAVTQRLAPLTSEGGVARCALDAPRLPDRRKALRALAVFLVSGGGALLAARMPWREWRYTLALHAAHYHAPQGESRGYTLADGGRIWLGSSGALDVDYDSRLRRLALYRGDLLVETASDTVIPARPFVVDTFHGCLRALGTRFAVRVDDATTRVDVFEGRVELTPEQPGHGRQVVDAGTHAVFGREGVVKNGVADPSRGAWARGVLLADGLRLDELLSEVGRWHVLSWSCAPDVAGLKVVGAYPLHDPERIFAALESSLPVSVRRDEKSVHITHRN